MALFNSPVSTNNTSNEVKETTKEEKKRPMTTEERYAQLDSMSDSEIMGAPDELPKLDIESLKKTKHFDKIEYEDTIQEDITTTNTPVPGLSSETFYLPSRNLLYGDKFDGHFNMRMFTTREERLRLSSRDTFLQTMCAILNNCITTDNGYKIDTKWFTEFDFIYTMYMSRIISYGPIYNIEVICPYCYSKFKHKVNLDSLPIEYLEDDFKEPITIGPLPMSKDTITVKILRIKDRIEMDKEATEIRITNPDYEGDPSYNLRLEYSIITVNDKELSPSEKKTYVEYLPAMDSQYINYKLNKIKAGVNTDVKVECPHCHEVTDTSLSINSTFFRPEFND